jgi:Ca2+-binding RTX toxin-like protein
MILSELLLQGIDTEETITGAAATVSLSSGGRGVTGVSAFVFNTGGDTSTGGEEDTTTGGEEDTTTGGEDTTDPIEEATEEISDVTDDPTAVIASVGTDGDDTLSAGERQPDVFYGNHGNDVIYATNNDDTIYGGQGVADSGDGDDSVFGNTGDDLIYGNSGNDTLYGGNDIVFFGDGADTIYGGRGNDFIFGGGGDDSLAGGGGVAHPEDEADTIYGGRGNDFIVGNGGDDFLFGGSSEIDDSDYVSDGSDTIYGGLGNDKINGGGPAADFLDGQFGNDTIEGGGVVDGYNGGVDTIYGGDGNDLIYGEDDSSESSADPAYGEDAPEDPNLYPDLIYGGNGIDTIYGGDGNDTIEGGAGNDLLYGGELNDVFVFRTGDGVDVIFDFQPEYDIIQIEAGINGLDITTADDVLAYAARTEFGYVIDLTNNGVALRIMLDDYMYEAEVGETTVLRYMPFGAGNIEII